MALTTKIVTQVLATLTSPLDLSTPADALEYTSRLSWSSGTGANAADMMWHDQRTLAASGTENIDLAGSLTGAFGTTLTFARIKGLVVGAASGNTNDVQVIRGASNGLAVFLANGDGLSVKPGGFVAWFSPGATSVAITAGSSDILTITNSAGSTSVTYDIVIIGASA